MWQTKIKNIEINVSMDKNTIMTILIKYGLEDSFKPIPSLIFTDYRQIGKHRH